MKKLFIFAFTTIISLSSCINIYKLDFAPSKVYGFSRYPINHEDINYEEKIIFENYEQLVNFYSDNSKFYDTSTNDKIFIKIRDEIDFENNNLLNICRYEGTSSCIHFIEVESNNIIIHDFCPEIITNDITFDHLLIPIEKNISLDEINIEYRAEILNYDMFDNLTYSYSSDYYF